ncbi:MAG TPA: ABC transporter ATP-binding protein [Pyrinomonadaceae bacterium]|nr:ABC transporter ATP-binding protein [Pyrinomonadaceae bacterium]
MITREQSSAESSSTALSIDHISKTYPVPFLRLKKMFGRKFKPPVEAVRDVSFDVGEGEIFGLIGPNGAGKTTLTKMIATLIQPTAGQVTVKGYDSVRDDQEVRSNVGLAGAEERSFYWRLTAEQNLLFFARLYGLSGSRARKRIAELLELLQMSDLSRRRFAELSTGNKQRLSVARAMLSNPPILLLDEPTRSLDPIAAARMRATIKSLTQPSGSDARATPVTVFLTSHNLAEVEQLCDRVAIISRGEIRALDTPQKLRATHTDSEQVSITFTAPDAMEVERALRAAFSIHSLTLERSTSPDAWVVGFSRKVEDDVLNSVLRVLQQSGCVIRDIASERATLLDVLESYEAKAADGKEEGK